MKYLRSQHWAAQIGIRKSEFVAKTQFQSIMKLTKREDQVLISISKDHNSKVFSSEYIIFRHVARNFEKGGSTKVKKCFLSENLKRVKINE